LNTSVVFLRLSVPRTAIHHRVERPFGAPLAAAAATVAADAALEPDAVLPGAEPDGDPKPCEPDDPPPAGADPPPPTTELPPETVGVGVTWPDGVVTAGVETVGVGTVGVGTVGVGAGGGGVVGTGAGGVGGGGRGGGGGSGGTVTDGTETVGTVTVGVGTDTWPSAAEAASPPRADTRPTTAAVLTSV
jgi:hypothetical protein